MDKIREILEKYAPIDGYLAIHGFEEDQCKIIRYADFDKLEQDLKSLMDSAVEEELKKFMTWIIKDADIEVVGVNAIEVGKLSGTMATPVLTMDKFIKYYLSLPKPLKE